MTKSKKKVHHIHVRSVIMPESSPVLPESEGEPKNVTFRMPEGLLRRVDGAAALTGHSRSVALNFLVRWALNQFEAERHPPKKAG